MKLYSIEGLIYFLIYKDSIQKKKKKKKKKKNKKKGKRVKNNFDDLL